MDGSLLWGKMHVYIYIYSKYSNPMDDLGYSNPMDDLGTCSFCRDGLKSSLETISSA